MNCQTYIFIDEIRLRKILYNLLGNAFKFTDTGSVTLTVSPAGNEHIEFKVADTGIGIPLDQQALIFESFNQQKKQNSSKYGGTGLGLSISKRLTEIMGGRITLLSEKGVGSVFTVSLPYQSSNNGS